MFLCVLLGALLLTTANFGFLYYGLHKSGPQYFSGAEGNTAIAEFFYFSFMVMTTSDLSPMKPVGWITKLVTVAQLCCSFALLSFFVLVFSSIGRDNLESARGTLDDLISKQEQKATQWEAQLKVPPLELPTDS